MKPEEKARQVIDGKLVAAGWVVQDREAINLSAGLGVAVREFKLTNGFVDYLLFVDGEAVGVVEAKPAGYPVLSVEPQAGSYSKGLPDTLVPPISPLPFVYISTGEVTVHFNLLDPRPRTRPIYQFHRPGTLAEWMSAAPLRTWTETWGEDLAVAELERLGVYGPKPSTLRSRLQAMPPVVLPNLWPNKVTAIRNLEQSLKEDRPPARRCGASFSRSATSTLCCAFLPGSSTPRASTRTCSSSTARRPARSPGPGSSGSTTSEPTSTSR